MDISLLCKFYQRVIWDVIWVVPSTSTGGLVKNLTQLRSQLLSFWLWYMVASLRTFFVGITWTDFLWWWFVCFIPQKHVFYAVLWCTRIYFIFIYIHRNIFDVTTSRPPVVFFKYILVHQIFTHRRFWSFKHEHVTHGDMDNAMDNVSLGPGPARSSRRRC